MRKIKIVNKHGVTKYKPYSEKEMEICEKHAERYGEKLEVYKSKKTRKEKNPYGFSLKKGLL